MRNLVKPTSEKSRQMSLVRAKDTSPELHVRHLLHKMGFRFRLHRKDLPGNPDIVFRSRKKIIQVHGCFWHGHACRRGRRKPKTNVEYWDQKIKRNIERDEKVMSELIALGWSVLTVWECELHDENLDKRLSDFLA